MLDALRPLAARSLESRPRLPLVHYSGYSAIEQARFMESCSYAAPVCLAGPALILL